MMQQGFNPNARNKVIAISRMLQRNAVQRLVPSAVIALLGVAASCRSAPPRPAEECTGQSFLVVQNQTHGPLDILLVKGTHNQIVGSAGPGRTTFALLSLNVTPDSRFAARRPQGAFLSVHNDSVTFSRECR
jgi:hypothetical protein